LNEPQDFGVGVTLGGEDEAESGREEGQLRFSAWAELALLRTERLCWQAKLFGS
jgi:hypothetical protein